MVMVNQQKKSRVLSDLAWVISIVKSVKSKEQLLISLKCFFLWEEKYKDVIDRLPNSQLPMRGVFWAIYRNKESQFSTLAVSE